MFNVLYPICMSISQIIQISYMVCQNGNVIFFWLIYCIHWQKCNNPICLMVIFHDLSISRGLHSSENILQQEESFYTEQEPQTILKRGWIHNQNCSASQKMAVKVLTTVFFQEPQANCSNRGSMMLWHSGTDMMKDMASHPNDPFQQLSAMYH